ncbi:DUF2079 domain-containing protein [Candidatus Puniceispirillum marinum]|uniref:DUF2079 domain-containing protein n=1 Tax=Puniceispirillum marinum (strain IMCC1322) TaxID=488538 RepID=D5BSH9_PUNMI|nr:DUF2079 domain-containing protein [Candidatus Puniceispirillum marinum]ADE39226.1 hypothetical protein SAR116_0983 [Candidatus Puniceispirillum marinum IMCC1322]
MSQSADIQQNSIRVFHHVMLFVATLVFGASVVLSVITFEQFFLNNKAASLVLRLVAIPIVFSFIGVLFFKLSNFEMPKISTYEKRLFMVISLVLVSLMISLKLLKYINLNYELFDLGLYYHQIQSIKLAPNLFDKLLFSLKGHFHPNLVIFSVIEQAFGFSSILVFQTLFLVSSLYPLYKLAEIHFENVKLQMLVMLAFLISPVIHFLDILGFHPDHVFLPSILWLSYFMTKNNKVGFFIFTATAVTAGEQWMPSLCALLLVYKADRGIVRHARIMAFAVFSIFIFYLWFKLTNSQVYSVFHQPADAVSIYSDPAIWIKKLFFGFWIGAAFLPFVVMNARLSIALIPAIAKILIVSEEYHVSVEGHYTYDIMAILFLIVATVDIKQLAKKMRALCQICLCILPFYFLGQGIGHGSMPYSVNFHSKFSASTFNYSKYLANSSMFQMSKMNDWISQNSALSIGVTNDAFVPKFAHRLHYGLINKNEDFDVIILSKKANQTFGSKLDETHNRLWLKKWQENLPLVGYKTIYTDDYYTIFSRVQAHMD